MPILIIIAIILVIILSTYNKLVKAQNRVKQAESGIDIYLNERFDLIPNLVECVKAYSKHEENIFVEITNLRTTYMNQTKNLENGANLNNKMNELIAVAENYPELKASEQYLNLQKNLTKIESQLQAARRIYNAEVTTYNDKITLVPSNIVAKMFGFQEEKLFINFFITKSLYLSLSSLYSFEVYENIPIIIVTNKFINTISKIVIIIENSFIVC